MKNIGFISVVISAYPFLCSLFFVPGTRDGVMRDARGCHGQTAIAASSGMQEASGLVHHGHRRLTAAQLQAA